MDPTAAILPESHTKIPFKGATAQARGAGRFDLFFTKATVLAGWGTVALLAWITFQIAYEAWPAMAKFHLGFIVSQDWDTDNEVYGALPFEKFLSGPPAGYVPQFVEQGWINARRVAEPQH